jgi:Uma2 family endonuclease
MSTTTKAITAENLFAMGDIGRCELIHGELVMMSPAGAEHGLIAMRFGSELRAFVEAHDLGVVFAAETGFRLADDLVCAPDAAFVRKERLSGGVPTEYFPGAPDLAVEVVSPGDRKRDVAEKVNRWLAHGTRAVWVAQPKKMTTTIHRTGQQPEVFNVNQTLTDEMTLPGFALPMTKVFRGIQPAKRTE